MRGIRIRWAGAAKAALIVVGALAGLQTLPGLLKPPEPPPLARDVGLPRAAPEVKPPQTQARPAAGPVSDRELSLAGESSRSSPPAAGARVIDGKPRKQARMRREERRSPKPASPPTAPAAVPAPEPLPYEPPPPPAPAPVGDGSEEFAPR